MISQFPRANYSQVAITITANEELGTPDPNYLQDYNGNDGLLTLLHEATGVRYPLLMGEVPAETPDIPHDVFRGYFMLTGRPNGLYWLQGRIRDVAGNYTILGAIANPNGTERILEIGIEVTAGIGIVKTIWLKLEGLNSVPVCLSFPAPHLEIELQNTAAIALGGLRDW